MTPVREALEPCPFCGGSATMEQTESNRWSVGCDNADEPTCMGYQSLTTFARRSEAVKAWNTRAAAPGEPCAVKPLEWQESDGNISGQKVWSSGDPWVFWIVKDSHDADYVWCENFNIEGWCPASPVRGTFKSLDAAKAAAQADYEQRIRSALVTTPQPAAGWDRAALRKLVDVVWNEATESTAVPSTRWSDRMIDAVRREAPAPAVDLTNHHNALKCPYCNPEGLTFASPDTAEARLREALKGLLGYVMARFPRCDQWRHNGKNVVLDAKALGGCICQNQHRRGYCTEPECPYALRPSEPSPPADRREIEPDRDQTSITLSKMIDDNRKLQAEVENLRSLISRPYMGAWADEILIEAAHQRDRWGADHDHGKSPEDWFWLIGYLAGKCLAAHKAGDIQKAHHHTVSTGAVLAHWAASIDGNESVFRPGVGAEKIAILAALDGGR